jgi:hypothetical protein
MHGPSVSAAVAADCRACLTTFDCCHTPMQRHAQYSPCPNSRVAAAHPHACQQERCTCPTAVHAVHVAKLLLVQRSLSSAAAVAAGVDGRPATHCHVSHFTGRLPSACAAFAAAAATGATW